LAGVAVSAHFRIGWLGSCSAPAQISVRSALVGMARSAAHSGAWWCSVVLENWAPLDAQVDTWCCSEASVPLGASVARGGAPRYAVERVGKGAVCALDGKRWHSVALGHGNPWCAAFSAVALYGTHRLALAHGRYTRWHTAVLGARLTCTAMARAVLCTRRWHNTSQQLPKRHQYSRANLRCFPEADRGLAVNGSQ